MSNTVPSEHPAVVVRFTHQHLRALLAIVIAVVLGLTIAIGVSATRGSSSPPGSLAPTTQPAIPANPSAEAGAKLDRSGHIGTAAQTSDRLANYPDAPPASSGWPQPSVSYYLDPPQP
jgi:hypothetical protein